jgi:hypothetical protein
LVVSPAFGADETEPPALEACARRVMLDAGKYLKAARQFTFRLEATHEVVLDTGQKLHYSGTHDVAVRRPDGLQADSRGDLFHTRLWYDGKRLTFLNVDEHTYSSLEVPDTVDEAFDYMGEEYGLTPPLIEIDYNEPAGTFLERVKTGIYVGLRQIRGIPFHHLAFTQDDLDWQIWIEDGWKPLLRKAVITYKKEPSYPQYVAFLSRWDFSPQLPDSAFSVLAPEGAERVDFQSVKSSTVPENEK